MSYKYKYIYTETRSIFFLRTCNSSSKIQWQGSSYNSSSPTSGSSSRIPFQSTKHRRKRMSGSPNITLIFILRFPVLRISYSSSQNIFGKIYRCWNRDASFICRIHVFLYLLAYLSTEIEVNPLHSISNICKCFAFFIYNLWL